MSELSVFYKSPTQLNGIAFDRRGRFFASYPNWSGKPQFSLAIIREGIAYPYPNMGINHRFQDINSIHEYKDHLYVVDKKAVYVIRLDWGTLVNVYNIPNSSRLNDIRFIGDKAYLTDSGNGCVFELNLSTGKSKTLLKNLMAPNDSVTVDNHELKMKVNIDGIEVTPNNTLLLSYPFGGPLHEYDIETKELKTVGELPPHGGMIIYRSDSILYGDPVGHSIRRYNYVTGEDSLYLDDERLNWPDAMIKYEGDYYVPAAKLTDPKHKPPFEVFSFK